MSTICLICRRPLPEHGCPNCGYSPGHTPPPRILVYCADPTLTHALDTWSAQHGVVITYAEKDRPDFYAVSGIAMIVDRTYMVKDVWQAYVDFVAEVDGGLVKFGGNTLTSTIDELVLVVDDRNDLPLPSLNSGRCIQIAPDNDRIRRVIAALNDALKYALRIAVEMPDCDNCDTLPAHHHLRIVFSTDNRALIDYIRNWAQGKGVAISQHSQDTCDVIMWSGDILICDRNYMHPDYWQRYLELAEEVQDGEQIEYEGEVIKFPKKTAIIVDDRADLPMPAPNTLNAYQVNTGTEMGLRRITEILDELLAEYLEREGGAERGC